MKKAVFLDVAPYNLIEVYRRCGGACCLVALMMEAANTSETSVNFFQNIRCNIPEDSHLSVQWFTNEASLNVAMYWLVVATFVRKKANI
jgi:hypothetical protein